MLLGIKSSMIVQFSSRGIDGLLRAASRAAHFIFPACRRLFFGIAFTLNLLLCAFTEVTAATIDNSSCSPTSFQIVIDVGHSRENSGAISARGMPEYEFNLRLARQITQSLVDSGYVKTELMITNGGLKTLVQRSVKANQLHADLFISIHHDSVQNIYLRKWTYENRLRVYSDRYKGYSIFVSHANAHRDASLQFATALGDALIARGMQFSTYHAEDIPGERRPLLDSRRGIFRYDKLAVLKNNNAPSILFEAGVIVNRDEELMLSSPAYQKSIASAFVAAMNQYCSAR